jgi:hypothetical protein
MLDDDTPPEITRANQTRFAEKPKAEPDHFDDAEQIARLEARESDGPGNRRIVPIYGGAFTLRLGGRRHMALKQSRWSGPDLQALLDEERANSHGYWLRHVARYQVERHLKGTGAKIVAIAPDLLDRLEALRKPNPAAPAMLSVQGLSPEQQDLAFRYRNYALARAKEFWQARWHLLNLDDLDDLRQTALIELCVAAKRFNPSWGVKFGAYIRLSIGGALADWLRESWSVVHRSPDAWKGWRAAHGPKGADWHDRSLDAPIRVTDEWSTSLLDLLPARGPDLEHLTDIKIIRERARLAAGHMSGLEHDVFVNRLLAPDPVPVADLADRHRVTKDYIYKVEARAVDKYIAGMQAAQARLLENNFRERVRFSDERRIYGIGKDDENER